MNTLRSTIIIAMMAFSSTCLSQIQMLRQQRLSRWNVLAANYSGITPLGNNRYAVVSDKQDKNGFYEFLIEQNPQSGKVENVTLLGFHSDGTAPHDAEAIAFFPPMNTVFIASESDQSITEYTLDGTPTHRSIAVPTMFSPAAITHNRGFESLSYSPQTGLFWTCTEAPTRHEAQQAESEHTSPYVTMQSFDSNLRASSSFRYTIDSPRSKSDAVDSAHGVAEVTALGDGTLLVLEREFTIAKGYIGSLVVSKVYRATPATAEKSLMAEWTTRLNITRRGIANYEGMCLGARLSDGRQTILLLSDSQGGYGNSMFHLKDYIKVGICSFPLP